MDLNIVACEACGRKIDRTGQKGRPRVFCDDDCRDFKIAVRRALELISLMRERATPRAWLELRADWWQHLNARPWNKGVKAGAAAALLARVRGTKVPRKPFPARPTEAA